MSVEKRIIELCELVARANRAYHVDAAPVMPDSEYDALLRELEALEAAHPELRDPNSPTQRVGGEPIEGFRTVPHAVPMMSIDNTYSVEDLQAWHERVLKGLDDETCPKMIRIGRPEQARPGVLRHYGRTVSREAPLSSRIPRKSAILFSSSSHSACGSDPGTIPAPA